MHPWRPSAHEREPKPWKQVRVIPQTFHWVPPMCQALWPQQYIKSLSLGTLYSGRQQTTHIFIISSSDKSFGENKTKEEKQSVVYTYNGHAAIKRNKPLISTTTWIEPWNITLGERKQIKKLHAIWFHLESENYRASKQFGSCWRRWRAGRG